jgi:hypothetical protein
MLISARSLPGMMGSPNVGAVVERRLAGQRPRLSNGTVATVVLLVQDFHRAWCHVVVAVSPYDPAVLLRTIRAVDRGVVDGSAIADLRPP